MFKSKSQLYWLYLEKGCHFTRVDQPEGPLFFRGLYKYVPQETGNEFYCLRYIVGNPYPTKDEEIDLDRLQRWYRAHTAAEKAAN